MPVPQLRHRLQAVRPLRRGRQPPRLNRPPRLPDRQFLGGGVRGRMEQGVLGLLASGCGWLHRARNFLRHSTIPRQSGGFGEFAAARPPSVKDAAGG